MPHKHTIHAFVMRVVRANIGKSLFICGLIFSAMLIVFIYETTGSRSGVAANTAELKRSLISATRGDSLITTLIDQDRFIPTTGELRWKVDYAPHAFQITVHGVADLGIMPNSSAEEACITHVLWDDSCECSGVGPAKSALHVVPGWDDQFTLDPNEQAIFITQYVRNESVPHLNRDVYYAVCIDSGMFVMNCISYRP